METGFGAREAGATHLPRRVSALLLEPSPRHEPDAGRLGRAVRGRARAKDTPSRHPPRTAGEDAPLAPGRARSAAVALLATALFVAVGLCQTPAAGPADNLEYWLDRATTATAPATATVPAAGRNPLGGGNRFSREDALPGVAILSDGTLIPGRIYTTRDRDLEVWIESEKRWRHIPLILLLGVEAVVTEEAMDKEWRWKEMGSPERYYTGRQRPFRRFLWKLHLIDDTYVTGAIKGQPIWIDTGRRKVKGPYLLHERSVGEYGQALEDLVYLRRMVISRRAMKAARKKRR
jgi:hypothetical protein